jgi:DNA invertase Pin-like site-specific DNA recombinase
MQENPRNNGKTLALLHGHDLDDRSTSPELAPIEGNGDIASTNGHAEGNLSAVIYLRVSTKEQAEKGGEREGFSIPAQREACKRKAVSLGAFVAEEFVDRGESARSAKRPELQKMLAYIKENPVTYAIVHKVDRLARNRVDDVEITLALRAAGATLVSCSENIDETPSGALLHGIMSSIAEFYSRNLASEVNKGLIQKAKSGGTPCKAPVGYLNVRKVEDGREVRTVEIDPERAPLVAWAFRAYASGQWTIRNLLEEVTRRGLLSKPTPKRPSQPIVISAFHEMLKNPYYIGIVRYRGIEYQGKHEPLIDRQTFDTVQRLLHEHNFAGEKQRSHHHYLKGSIFCGKETGHGEECRSRLIVTNAKSRSGRIYPYFVCIGRQKKRNDCTQKALLIEDVEEAVADYYKNVELSPELRMQTEQKILEQIAELREDSGVERARLVTRQRRALSERRKLLEAHYAGALPLDLLKSEQERLGEELEYIESRLSAMELKFDTVERNLKAAFSFVTNLHDAYVAASSTVRRRINQAIFERFLITDDGDVVGELKPPFDLLLQASGIADKGVAVRRKAREKQRAPARGPLGLNKDSLVELGGFEPGASRVLVPPAVSGGSVGRSRPA